MKNSMKKMKVFKEIKKQTLNGFSPGIFRKKKIDLKFVFAKTDHKIYLARKASGIEGEQQLVSDNF